MAISKIYIKFWKSIARFLTFLEPWKARGSGARPSCPMALVCVTLHFLCGGSGTRQQWPVKHGNRFPLEAYIISAMTNQSNTWIDLNNVINMYIMHNCTCTLKFSNASWLINFCRPHHIYLHYSGLMEVDESHNTHDGSSFHVPLRWKSSRRYI